MFTKSSVPQALIDATKAIMEASDKKLLLEPSKKMPAADKVPERVQAAISKKKDDKAAASGSSAEVREAKEEKASDNPNSPFNYKGQPSTLFNKPGSKAGFDSKKISTGTVYTRKYKKDKEEIKEAINDNLHPAGAALLKHIKPEHHNLYKPHLTSDVFNGSFKDRHDVLSAAKQAGHLNEDVEQVEEGSRQTLAKKLTNKMYKIDKGLGKLAKDQNKTDVSTNMSSAKSDMRKAVGKASDSDVKKMLNKEEVEQVDERTLSKGETAEKERIVKGMKKSLSGFKARYGDRAKNVMYATATKQAMKEEEELDEVLKGKQHKIDKNKNGKIDKQDFELLRKEDIGGISTISEKKKGMKEVKEAEEAENVRIEPNEDMKTKTVDTLAGRKKVPADYHNQTKSYKLKLNVEGKGTDVDPNFVTNESTPMKLAKEMAKKSFKKIRTETLGMAGATSEEKKK